MFTIKSNQILSTDLNELLQDKGSGGVVIFEGKVRNNNEGKTVKSLEYQVYHSLALKEGNKIIEEAKNKFSINGAWAIHREGHLELEDIAIIIGTMAKHRSDAYKANQYIIDQIKLRLPIWKKEHYLCEEPKWVFCKDHLHHAHICSHEYYKKQSNIIDQNKLTQKKVIVIGAGGLGCSVLTSLAQAGIGEITIVDFDQVSATNLHRQFLYSPHQVGEFKSEIAKLKLKEMNPLIKIRSLCLDINQLNAINILKDQDLVIDCTDNLLTKYLLHDSCIKIILPLITGSVFKNQGTIRTFNHDFSQGCFNCYSPKNQTDEFIGNCNDFGVLGSTVNFFGSLMASEAIQFFNKSLNESLKHTLLIDLENLTFQKILNKKNQNCIKCSNQDFEVTIFKNLEVTNDQLSDDSNIIDVKSLSINEVIPLLTPDKKNVLFCHRGIRSKSITISLREQGYSNTFSLKGGECSL